MAQPTVTEAPAPSAAVPCAIAWIDPRRAIVVSMHPDREVTTCEIARGSLEESVYLAQVVRVIGDCQRVVILGPGTDRLALEREYVDIFRRPERLVDVEPARPVPPEELVRRLRVLAA